METEGWEANEIIRGLYLGKVVSACDRAGLESHGVTHIVYISSESDPPYVEDFVHLVCRLGEEHGSREILTVMMSVFYFIENALEKGGNVLVCCERGVSRSPVMVMAYLLKKHRDAFAWNNVSDCWEWLRVRRKRVYPHPSYLKLLRELYPSFFGRKCMRK